jgi:uncharacterized heparinase superfamily protein
VGEHEIQFPIHLHPEVRVKKGKNNQLILSNKSARIVVKLASDVAYKVEQSWYSTGYGIKTRNKVINLHTKQKLPCKILTIFELR